MFSQLDPNRKELLAQTVIGGGVAVLDGKGKEFMKNLAMASRNHLLDQKNIKDNINNITDFAKPFVKDKDGFLPNFIKMMVLKRLSNQA